MYVSAAAGKASARKRESCSAAKLDDRQVLAAFDEAHRESDSLSVALGSTGSMRPSRPRLDSPPNRRATIVDIPRRLPGERHVRAPLVIPGRIKSKFAAHRFQRQRDKNETRALALRRTDEPFDICSSLSHGGVFVNRGGSGTLQGFRILGATRVEGTIRRSTALDMEQRRSKR